MNRNEIVHYLETCFRKREDIHTVLLYGSAVDGIFTDDSDVDVAIAGQQELSPEEKVVIYQELEKGLKRKVDVRDLNRQNGIFLCQILMNGVLVKNSDPGYLEKRTAEMIEFRQDILPILREGMTDRLHRFADGR